MFSSSNPALKTNTFAKFRDQLGSQVDAERNVMTLQGTINKTALLLIMTFAAAAYPWTLFFNGDAHLMWPIAGVGGLVAFSLSWFSIFMKPTAVRWVAPVVAVAEGLFLGAISASTEAYLPGVPMIAALATLGVLASMLILYKTGLVKVTQRFRSVVMTAVGAVMLLALASFFFNIFFGFSLLYYGGMLGVGVSGAIVVVFSLYLLVQFKEIEEAAEARSPKWTEWYGAFGILIALVWLYVEILHIVSILARE